METTPKGLQLGTDATMATFSLVRPLAGVKVMDGDGVTCEG